MDARLQRVAKTNNRLAIVDALRDEVWRSINDSKTGGRDIAALVKRWLELSEDNRGKSRESLETLRDILAARIVESNSGRDIAAMSKRLIEVLDEIEALPDDNAKKNAAQRAREMVRKRGIA